MFCSVIFDLDGTLLNTLPDLAACGNRTLEHLGYPTHPEDAYRKKVGNGVRKLVARMLPEEHRTENIIENALNIFNNEYVQHMLDMTHPYDGILPMLHKFKKAGLPMGVVSNKPDAFTRDIVARFFPDVFAAAVGMRDGYPAKPDATSVLELAGTIGADLASLLYVGDSDVDMLTANNAKVPGCGVSWGFRDSAELRAAGAAYIVDTPEQLAALVLGPQP